MRIGLLGGTFNPIHVGHLKIAQAVRHTLKLSAVWFIPTGKAPHKKEEAEPSRANRLEMVRLAIQDNPYFKACDIEIKRPEVSYTIDTLTLLKQIHPKATFFFIIGTDAFSNLHQWKAPERLLETTPFVIVPRMGHPFSHLPNLTILNGINITALKELDCNQRKKYRFSAPNGCRLYFVHTPFHPISADEIRNRIQSGKTIKTLLPQQILSYIMEEGLYKRRVENS